MNLETKMQQGWDYALAAFFRPEVNLFYDYRTESGLDTLPNAAEVRRSFPNVCGWGTGMEDCAINAGVWLAMISERYAVTGESALQPLATMLLDGLYRCLSVHGDPGFLARGLCPEDGVSVYPCSSRDQYTNAAHGIWKYFHSGLAAESDRERIREMAVSMAEYMHRHVTPESGFDFNFHKLNRTPSPGNVCKMWETEAHEAARLPMIYACAWSVTQDPHWEREYRQYARTALEQSRQLMMMPYLAYALFQMSCSLEVIFHTDPDEDNRRLCREAWSVAAEYAAGTPFVHFDALAGDAYRQPAPDWRKQTPFVDNLGVPCPDNADFFTACMMPWRSTAEAFSVMLSAGAPLSTLQRGFLQRLLTTPEPAGFRNYALFNLLQVYWQWRRAGGDYGCGAS